MFCKNCGTELPEKSEFCHKCGAKQTAPEETQSAVNVQEAETGQSVSTDINDFKNFVDNHVRTATKFSSAEDLLKRSKPWTFAWICFGVVILAFLLLGLNADMVLGSLFLGLFFGYAVTFIASGIIRSIYETKFVGDFSSGIDIDDFRAFLDKHLQYISPDFHEWGFLSSKGLIAVFDNALLKNKKEVRICAEFGPKRKRLVEFDIGPKKTGAESGEQWYYLATARKNGFLLDGRMSKFIAHGTLIRTAPILQAAMEYYLKLNNKK